MVSGWLLVINNFTNNTIRTVKFNFLNLTNTYTITTATNKDVYTWTFPTAYQFSNSYAIVCTSNQSNCRCRNTKTNANAVINLYNGGGSKNTVTLIGAIAFGY